MERDPSHPGKFVLVIGATSGTERLRLQALQHSKVIEVSLLPPHGGRARRLGEVRAKHVVGVAVFGKASVQQLGLKLPVTFEKAAASTSKTKKSPTHTARHENKVMLDSAALDAALAEWLQHDTVTGKHAGA
jgi:hypothetical protein